MRKTESKNVVTRMLQRQFLPSPYRPQHHHHNATPRLHNLFDSVPPECIIQLIQVEDELREIRKCVLIGFSRCANFLCSYSAPQNVSGEADFALSFTDDEVDDESDFEFHFWRFHFDSPLIKAYSVPFLGIPVAECDPIPTGIIEHYGGIELAQRSLKSNECRVRSLIPKFALFRNVGSVALSSSLHVQMTESIDGRLFYNYMFCNIDEHERKHIVTIMPSLLCSAFASVNYMWGIMIEFVSVTPHPTPFLPLSCISEIQSQSPQSRVLSTQVCVIPSGNCIDLVRFELRKHSRAEIIAPAKSLIAESGNMQSRLSEVISLSHVLFKRGSSDACDDNSQQHVYLNVIRCDHVNIEEYVNTCLKDVERLVDYEYRIHQKLENSELLIVIAADAIDKSGSNTRLRLVSYASIDLQNVHIRCLFNHRSTCTTLGMNHHLIEVAKKLFHINQRRLSKRHTLITHTNENIFNKNASKPYILHPFIPLAIISPQ